MKDKFYIAFAFFTVGFATSTAITYSDHTALIPAVASAYIGVLKLAKII